mmetsp:Transcript_8660/g.36105  ORF Transcript_8660/g.36105 Transcript_8660/m.36105 type:complete len:500 (-) Transcript_8660:29-1528(-)|eukprot:CAMPEP_0114628428 /NCGR_PEP_ID=MMETSP0168-20121206/12816_1 /TAXON_ID=95228 ORGANISM="Vannella sp., Strain DIVA3 517/6/12" /NCGR_SAMPLE_ID=MMETSP0168 /ASSEMBLY_ACC=CAM_ASM_000044 /LENGTH=499 /DNA_ID=CAMNT_0001839811 /DNA_START=36 /DNA_END=1535 /DNA_ORIENTATION=-
MEIPEVLQTYLDVTPIRNLMSPLNAVTAAMGEASGLPEDQLDFLLLFILAYPLALIHRQIYNPTLRHIFAMVFGILTVIYVIGNQVYHSFFSTLVAYIILRAMPNKLGSKLIWVWAFGYMATSHLYRQYVDYLGWTVDFTTTQMVITLKMIALGCNAQDGHTKDKSSLSSRQKSLALGPGELPSLLEYYSYMHFWCTVLPGPFFEYKQYISFIDRSMFKETNGEIPAGSLKAFAFLWLKLLVVIYGVITAFSYPISNLHDAEFIANTTFQYRWFYLLVCCMCIRSKYYTGWLMSEGASILCGFSFNGYDAQKNAKWDRLTNINLVGVELAQNLRHVVAEWNKGTALWLKNYVYFRVSKRPLREGEDPKTTKRPGLPPAQGQLVVYVVSAIWHGFYPGYYYFFVGYFFFSHVGNSLGPWVTSRVYKEGTVLGHIYTAFCILLTLTVLDYNAASFAVLAHSYSIEVWTGFYFYLHIIIVVLFGLVSAGFFRPPRRAPKKTN